MRIDGMHGEEREIANDLPLPGTAGRWLSTTGSLLLIAILATGCSVLPPPVSSPRSSPVSTESTSVGDEFSELQARLQRDLELAREHQPWHEEMRKAPPSPAPPKESVLASLEIPVIGVRPSQLEDNFGAPRDGGIRSHRGIDIFAPRGTKVVAVAEGWISYVGVQSKGGRCLWLTTASGVSFYYAHLDRWASGLYEGLRVERGDVLGYVGNTGNAIHTPFHLHFQVADDAGVLNPYPILIGASPGRANPELAGGFGR